MINPKLDGKMLQLENDIVNIDLKVKAAQSALSNFESDNESIKSEVDNAENKDSSISQDFAKLDEVLVGAELPFTVFYKYDGLETEEELSIYENRRFYMYVPDGCVVIDGENLDFETECENYYVKSVPCLKVEDISLDEEESQNVYLHIRVEKKSGKNEIKSKVDTEADMSSDLSEWAPGVRFYNILLGKFDGAYDRYCVDKIVLNEKPLYAAFEVVGQDGGWGIRYYQGCITYNNQTPDTITPAPINNIISTGLSEKNGTIYGSIFAISSDSGSDSSGSGEYDIVEFKMGDSPFTGEGCRLCFKIADIIDGEVKQIALGAIHLNGGGGGGESHTVDDNSIEYVCDDAGNPKLDVDGKKIVQVYDFEKADASAAEAFQEGTIARMLVPKIPWDKNESLPDPSPIAIPCKEEGKEELQWKKLGQVDMFEIIPLDEASIDTNDQNFIEIKGFEKADANVANGREAGTIAAALTPEEGASVEGIAIPCKVKGQGRIIWKKLGQISLGTDSGGSDSDTYVYVVKKVEWDGYNIIAKKDKLTFNNGLLVSVEEAEKDTIDTTPYP